jgi:hypothetical protein
MALGDILYGIKQAASTQGKKTVSVFRRARPLIIAGLAILVFVPLITALVVTTIRSREAQVEAAPASLFSNLSIPKEEIYLGDEPDFLPPVIPFQAQRKTWTADDANPYWTDPAALGEAAIREKISGAVDMIFENVP